MKHLNCFVLEAIAGSIRQKVPGAEVKDCYSNSPDEWILEFDNLMINIEFYGAEMYFEFDVNVSKSRLYKPQFREIKGLKCLDVRIHRFERSFSLLFEQGYELVFKAHGRRSNLILFKDSVFSDHFKRSLESDRQLLPDMFKDRELPMYDTFKTAADRKESYAFLPQETMKELEDSADSESFYSILEKYRHISGFTFVNDELKPGFTDIENTIPEDISRFSISVLKEKRFSQLYSALLNDTEKKIHEKTAFLHSNRIALQQLESKRNDEEIAHIILAGMHGIPAGASKADLPDIYTGETIRVKLDEKLSPVENADRYFRKAKSRPHTLKQLKDKIKSAESELESLSKKKSELLDISNWKELRPFIKQKQNSVKETELPYRKFSIENYDVLVGKNADSNEKILNYYSDKDDIWLHAKDVSGSHVLIRSGKSQVPLKVIEKAAAIAAYYSKNRKQDLATVTYTLRKYVRKIKGAEKGNVSVSRESTVLVKPGI